MNISEAVEAIITISIGYMDDMKNYQTEIANILQKLQVQRYIYENLFN